MRTYLRKVTADGFIRFEGYLWSTKAAAINEYRGKHVIVLPNDYPAIELNIFRATTTRWIAVMYKIKKF